MNKTVLLIEGDFDIAEAIRYILADLGFTVVNSSEMTFANDILDHRPVLILLDYWLPGSTGDRVCCKLKGEPGTRDIPVILTSATNNPEKAACSCGAEDYLAKPFDINELEAKVMKWAAVL